MNEYTIKVGTVGVAVFDGKLKGARLKYQGGNLNVYVSGCLCNKKNIDDVHYHAMSLARAHHIPLTSFKAYGRV